MNKIIQVIYEDESKERFIGDIIKRPDKTIIWQKILTEDEKTKKIIKDGNDWIFVEPDIPGKDIEYLKNKVIYHKMRKIIGEGEGFDMSVDTDLITFYKNQINK
jgi:hypothetical protein